jgi:hypothetical protein
MSCRVLLNIFALAVLLQGCESNQSLRVVSTDTSPLTSSEAATKTRPPKCKGQVVIAHHAEVTEQIPREGAGLCVPSFRGFGGDLGFPGVHPAPEPVKLIVTVPQLGMVLGNHRPIFNLEWLPGAQFTFGKTAPPGGISGARMIPGKTYTGYGVIGFKGGTKKVGPCYSVAARGKYGGVFNNLGTLMEKQGDSFITWDLMIYDGKEANRGC